MELSEIIRTIREKKRIKLSDMADALGIDVSNYAKIEKKENKLTLERIEQIASVLKVSVIEILDQHYDRQLQSQIERLEEENQELKHKMEMYGPVITMVDFMMKNPSQVEEFAQKATTGKVGKSDVEKSFPTLKEIFEKPTSPKPKKKAN